MNPASSSARPTRHAVRLARHGSPAAIASSPATIASSPAAIASNPATIAGNLVTGNGKNDSKCVKNAEKPLPALENGQKATVGGVGGVMEMESCGVANDSSPRRQPWVWVGEII